MDRSQLGQFLPTADWPWPTSWAQNGERECSAHHTTDEGFQNVQCDSAYVWKWLLLPQAWQVQLWGTVLNENGFWLCPNVWNDYRLACLSMSPPQDDNSRGAREDAEWLWKDALRQREQRVASRPESVDFATARCAACGGGTQQFIGRWMHECPAEPVPEGVATPRATLPASLVVANGGWAAGAHPRESASPTTTTLDLPTRDQEEAEARDLGEHPPLPEMTWDEIVHGRERNEELPDGSC